MLESISDYDDDEDENDDNESDDDENDEVGCTFKNISGIKYAT